MLDVEQLIAGVHEYIERALAPLVKRIEEQDSEIAGLRKSLTELPAPKDGESVTIDMVLPSVTAGMNEEISRQLAKAIETIGKPQDGKSVTLDDLKPTMDAWALSFERYANGVLQRAIEMMPKPKDGNDGFSLDDLQMSFDGERKVTLKFERGALSKSLDIVMPTILDKGVFREDGAYVKNDGVTFGGSFYIVQKDEPQGKPGQSDDFRLSVKRGRDGKGA